MLKDIGVKEYEARFNENTKLFSSSAQHLSHQQNEMISIKLTGLVDMKLLKKMNDSIELRDKFWK